MDTTRREHQDPTSVPLVDNQTLRDRTQLQLVNGFLREIGLFDAAGGAAVRLADAAGMSPDDVTRVISDPAIAASDLGTVIRAASKMITKATANAGWYYGYLRDLDQERPDGECMPGRVAWQLHAALEATRQALGRFTVSLRPLAADDEKVRRTRGPHVSGFIGRFRSNR